MRTFPSDVEPQFFTSVKQSNRWSTWATIALAAILVFFGQWIGLSKWVVVGIVIAVYLILPKLCLRKQTLDGPSISFEKSLLIATWQKILAEDPPQAWVLFRQGTCVLFNNSVADPQSKAKKILKKWGPSHAGATSGDMLVTTLRNGLGFVVGGHHPDVFSFVIPEVGLGEKTGACIPGLIGRHQRNLDAQTLEVIHVESRS